jgi:hypothetical protein
MRLCSSGIFQPLACCRASNGGTSRSMTGRTAYGARLRCWPRYVR